MNGRFVRYATLDGEIRVPPKMRAVIMAKPGLENLRIAEVDVPEPNADQMLARVDACTICPSTMKLLSQGSRHQFIHGWDTEKFPVILGDEGSVTVVKVGGNLAGEYAPGERLVIQPAVDHEPINHRERYQDVGSMKKVAVGYTLGGHLAEYILIREEVLKAGCAVKLPDRAVGYFEASLTEPASCVVSSQDHHVHLVTDPATGKRVPKKGILEGGVTAIFGAGVMGRLHAELAVSYRPRWIIIFNQTAGRFTWIKRCLLAGAKEKGVDIHCVLVPGGGSAGEFVGAKVREISGRDHADDAIDATGSAVMHALALGIAGRGSVVNSFGGLSMENSVIGVDMRKVHYDEMIVTGSSGGNRGDTVRTLELISSGVLDLGKYISRVGVLGHAIEFLGLVKDRKIDGKAVVYPHATASRPLAVEDGWSREREMEFLEDRLA
jgi:threonine dehydrogenase-like Zn-dependent dehydrogenase